MPNNYGYMAKIGVDTSGLQSGLKEINSELKSIDSSLSATNKAITNAAKAGTDSTELQVQKYDILKTQIEYVQDKLTGLESINKKVAEAYENGAIPYGEYIEFNNELANTVSKLESLKLQAEETNAILNPPQISGYQNFSESISQIDANITGLSSEIKEINRAIEETGGSEELTAQKTEILGKAISETEKKLQLLKNSQNEINEALAKGDITDEQYRKWQRDIETTTASLKKLTEEQKNFGKATDEAGQKAISLGDIIKGNMISDAVMSGLRSLGNILKESARAAAEFAKEGIDLASDLSEVQNVVDVTFGDNNNKIYEFADTSAEKFGMAKLSAEKYAGTMGALLKSSGINEGLEEMSLNLTALSGDMANFHNLNTDTAFEKLRSGISGETEPLKQLGINMNVANLEAYALSQGIEKSWKTMSQAEQTMLRYNYIMSQTADVQGDFARTSDSMANQQRILQLNLQSVKAEVGEELLPAAKDFVTMLNENMPAIKDAAVYFGGELADSLETLAEKAEAFVQSGGLERTVDTLKWVVDNGDKIITVGTGIMAVINAKKITESAAAFKTVTGELGNMIGLSSSIDGLSKSTELSGNAANIAAGKFSAYALAISGAVLAAEMLSGAIDDAADRLGKHSETVTNIEYVADSIEKAKNDFKELSETDIAAAWRQADTDIAEYKNQLTSLDKEITDIQEQISNDGFKYFYDNSGNLVNTEFTDVDELRDRLGSKYRYQSELKQLISEEEKLYNQYNESTIANIERSAEVKANAQSNAGKTNEEIISQIWNNIAESTDNEMSRLDDEFAKHNLTEQEYLEQRISYLEAHRNKDSVEWHKYYDKAIEDLEQLNEKERKAIEDSANETEKTLKESVQKKIAALERQQKESGGALDDKWFVDEMKKIIDSDLEEGTDLYFEFYDKWLDKQNSVNEKIADSTQKEIDEWQKSADKISDAVKKKYEDVQSEFESSRQEYINALDLSEEITVAQNNAQAALGLAVAINPNDAGQDDKDKKKLIFKDITPQTAKLRQYNENMEALEKTGISDEYLEKIKAMDFNKRQEYVAELLQLSDSQLKKHYSDMDAYYAEARKAAARDVSDSLAEADLAAAEGTVNILADMPESAYESGKATAQAYLQGFTDTMKNTNNILAGTIVSESAAKSGNDYSDAARAAANMDGSFSARGGDIVINLGGKEIFRSAIDEYVKDVNNSGGMLGG